MDQSTSDRRSDARPPRSLSTCPEGWSRIAGASQALFPRCSVSALTSPLYCMRQRLHRLWKRLGLNTRRRGSIPHASLPCLRIAACGCAVRPQHARVQYSSAAVRPRYQLRLPTSRLRARRARVPHCASARSRPSPILFASSPLLRFLALDILDTFPISGLTFPFTPLSSRLTARCPPIAQPGRSIDAGWRCLPSRAQPVQTRARPCSAVPDLPVRHPAHAVGSAHGFAVHQAYTSPPILPSSSTLFPSHLKTRPALLAFGRLRRLATSENGHL
jgi:hypothetical protein